MARDLPARVAAAIARHRLLRPGSRVAAAVSGGADSVALLLLLHGLADRLGLVVSVAHFDHRLRAESGEDAAFVRALAARLGLPLFEAAADIAAAARASRGNLEQVARQSRYEFFESLVRAGNISHVATGHNLDDQAETVLLRLLRGTGTPGLVGIWPRRPALSGTAWRQPWLIRPLLGIRRAELREWLNLQEQTWRDDASNRSLDRARNRLRHITLPGLMADFNPALPQRLATLAEVARAEERYWRALVRRRAQKIWRLLPDRDGWYAERRALARLPLALRRRIIREGLRLAKGDLRRIDFAAIERLVICIGDDVPAAAPGPCHLQLAGVACECTRAALKLRKTNGYRS